VAFPRGVDGCSVPYFQFISQRILSNPITIPDLTPTAPQYRSASSTPFSGLRARACLIAIEKSPPNRRHTLKLSPSTNPPSFIHKSRFGPQHNDFPVLSQGRTGLWLGSIITASRKYKTPLRKTLLLFILINIFTQFLTTLCNGERPARNHYGRDHAVLAMRQDGRGHCTEVQ
jgi:hypothetical protein